MGLAVFDGIVYPLWAGNLNLSTDPSGTIIPNPLDIFMQQMAIAAGPRIINSTMGPISLATAESGSDTVLLQFDRPVTKSSVVAADISVSFLGTTDTSTPVTLTVTGVNAVGGTNTNPAEPNAYTEFMFTFDTLPQGANPATYNFVGTYSYFVAPDNGAGLAISAGRGLRRLDPPHR